MNIQIPQIVTSAPPLQQKRNNLSVDTLTAKDLALSTPPVNFNSFSPTQKSYYKSLPPSVTPIESTDTERLKQIINSASSRLLVDVRPFNLYSTSHLKHSYNICIPTTLIKRPSYDLKHVISASSLPEREKKRLLVLDKEMDVILYDGSSTDSLVSFQLYQTAVKFTSCDHYNVYFLNGGIDKVSSLLVQRSTLEAVTPVSPQTPLSAQEANKEAKTTKPASSEGLPFLSGFTLPSATASDQKLLMSIKKNLPRLDTTIKYDYNFKFPPGFAEKKEKLPKWLRIFAEAYERDNSNKEIVDHLSDKFNRLEASEQIRLSMAIANDDLSSEALDSASCHLHNSTGYGTPLALCPFCDKIDYSIPKGIEFGYKNRYNNIWPYEHSRVRLISSPSHPVRKETDDYFNANYISFDKMSSAKYIATQNPLEATYEDFWNAVWYNRVKAIVCLDKPSVFSQGTYYEKNLDMEKSSMLVRIVDREDCDGFTLRTIHLTKHGETSVIHHFSYKDWPDFGTPVDVKLVFHMIELKNQKLLALSVRAPADKSEWDVLVHCSAGCGRTGCFITMDMIVNCFQEKQKGRFDPWGDEDLIYKSVQFQRQQRISMVQNLDQFIYCYESILAYVVENYC